MPVTHLMLALAVVFIWGTNFVVIKWGLAEFDPFLFAALRFALCIVPWIFFIPRPAVAWSRLAWFGVLLGAGQFGLLFMAMRADVTPGLASLVMQSQVFFTIGLSMALQGERVAGPQYLAMALAVGGISLMHPGQSVEPECRDHRRLEGVAARGRGRARGAGSLHDRAQLAARPCGRRAGRRAPMRRAGMVCQCPRGTARTVAGHGRGACAHAGLQAGNAPHAA